jgi:hypothetical protein
MHLLLQPTWIGLLIRTTITSFILVEIFYLDYGLYTKGFFFTIAWIIFLIINLYIYKLISFKKNKESKFETLLLQLGIHAQDARPWFLVIGATGSGKSSILEKSGLNLASSELDFYRIWYGTQAIFFEMPEDFLHQKSMKEDFLRDLYHARPYLPINSILLSVNLMDILLSDPLERIQFFNLFTANIQSIHQQLNCIMPLYIYASRTDLLPGFQDFFTGLDPDSIHRCFSMIEPWGKHFETQHQPYTLNHLLKELIQAMRFVTLDQTNKSPTPCHWSYGFFYPMQMSFAAKILIECLEPLLGKLQGYAVFRALFFVSCQENNLALDCLMPIIAKQFSIPLDAFQPKLVDVKTPPQSCQQFIQESFSAVILKEAGKAYDGALFYKKQILKRKAFWVVLTFLCTYWTTHMFFDFKKQFFWTQFEHVQIKNLSYIQEKRRLNALDLVELCWQEPFEKTHFKRNKTLLVESKRKLEIALLGKPALEMLEKALLDPNLDSRQAQRIASFYKNLFSGKNNPDDIARWAKRSALLYNTSDINRLKIEQRWIRFFSQPISDIFLRQDILDYIDFNALKKS